MEFSLDYKLAADSTGLLPILDMKAPSNLTKQVWPHPLGTYWAHNSGFDIFLLPPPWVETPALCRGLVSRSSLVQPLNSSMRADWRWQVNFQGCKWTNFLWTATWLAQRVTNQAGSSTIAKLQRAGDSSCYLLQAHILLDCGEDNICKPDLRLSVKR